MGPNNNETSGMQLPAPQPEQLPAVNENSQADTAPEQGQAAAPEQAKNVTNAAPPAGSMPLPIFPSAPPAQGSQDDVSSTTTSHLQADSDADLIEKEWVNKAKQIVEKTRDDPYKQSEELTVVKADYIKKRYNKTIKLNK
jgi:hypothetical protein